MGTTNHYSDLEIQYAEAFTVPGHNLYETNKICLHSGHYMDILNPTPGDISVFDMAHGCAHTPRWSGQARKFLSSAQHGVMVYRRIGEKIASGDRFPEYATPEKNIALRLQAWGHDGSDGYFFDPPSPIKRRVSQIVKVENGLMKKAIAPRFNFPWPMHPLVKEADKEQLEYEWKHFMHGDTKPWSMETAKRLFLQTYSDIIHLKHKFGLKLTLQEFTDAVNIIREYSKTYSSVKFDEVQLQVCHFTKNLSPIQALTELVTLNSIP